MTRDTLTFNAILQIVVFQYICFNFFDLAHKQSKTPTSRLETGRAVFFSKPPERRMSKEMPRNLDHFERLSSYGVPRVRHNPRQILILYAERKRGLCGAAVPGYR